MNCCCRVSNIQKYSLLFLLAIFGLALVFGESILLDFVYPTEQNASSINHPWFEINTTIDTGNFSEFILNWNGSNTSYTNASPEISSYNSSRYLFYKNISGLSEGTYTYYAWANDTDNNLTQTDERIVTIDLTAPTLTNLALNDTSPLAAGNVTFTLDFSEEMNVSVSPIVKIQNTSEYTITATGWSNSTRWVGWYNFTISTGDGNYTINVTGAEDLAGNLMVPD
ncbi:MAG: hypothetical protein JW727_04610, partial [Candidatus Aenigmarchaeota archaeon]|nr:hypothetical protein [Candidatus Aenigmarchaeota archaeon]